MKKPPSRRSEPMQYLAFSTAEKGFLGGIILHGTEVREMSQRAWRLGINPGGAVMAVPVPPEFAVHVPVAKLERLLEQAELEDLWETVQELRAHEQAAASRRRS